MIVPDSLSPPTMQSKDDVHRYRILPNYLSDHGRRTSLSSRKCLGIRHPPSTRADHYDTLLYHWELESSWFFLAILTRIRDQIWIPDKKLAYNQWPPITFCQCIDQMCITINTL